MNPGFCEKMEVTRVPLGRPLRTTSGTYAYHRLGTPALHASLVTHGKRATVAGAPFARLHLHSRKAHYYS